MDIVVHTPHGDAEVSIVAHRSSATIGDVIAEVTGQAVPLIAQVDDRTVDASTRITDAGLAIGSVVATEPGNPHRDEAAVELVQIAGFGAGRRVRLGPGRYRVGPGRRSGAAELALAAVEEPRFEIAIDATPASPKVSVSSDSATALLDGVPVTSPTRWQAGILSLGTRAFRLDAPHRPTATRALPTPADDGTVAFSRPPRRTSKPHRWPLDDAIRDADAAAPTLWERRPAHGDAFQVAFGVTADAIGASVATLDLGAERAVGIAGSERFRSALARTILLEAATLHGPADLHIVVLTNADRAATWDWAKWLPHARVDGAPAVRALPHEIAGWVDANGPAREMPARPASAALTLVVVDDPGLWTTRDSPLRLLLTQPLGQQRLIALCDDALHAPAVCTAVVAECADGSAQLHSFVDDTENSEGILPALAEETVAARTARSLAPLADVDLPPDPPAPTRAAPATLAELAGLADPDSVVDRWETGEPRTLVTIGHRDELDVAVDIDVDVTAVVAASIGEAFDVAATSLLAQCADRSPDAMWVVPLGFDDGPIAEQLWRLPHTTERPETGSAIEPGRLFVRLRSVLADPDGPVRVVLIVNTSASAIVADDMLIELAEGARSVDGISMLAVGDRPDLAELGADIVVSVEAHGRRDATLGRVATMMLAAGSPTPPFLPVQPPTEPGTALDLLPFTVGRSLTPLERRLRQRRSAATNEASPAVIAAIGLLRTSTTDTATVGAGRVAMPPPMPTHVDLGELFTANPGDGVPIGVTDDPTAAAIATQWWEPARGSLLLFGSRRSGVDHVITTLLVGVVERFAAEDVRLFVIDSSPVTRRALNRLDRGVHITAADEAADVEGALDEIAAEVERFRNGERDQARMVVVIADLVQLRRSHQDTVLSNRIDDIITEAALDGSGIDVIAYASELEGAGPFAQHAMTRLVGASSNHGDLSTLGVRHPEELGGIVGRCRRLPGDSSVQLATSDVTIERLLDRGGSDR